MRVAFNSAATPLITLATTTVTNCVNKDDDGLRGRQLPRSALVCMHHRTLTARELTKKHHVTEYISIIIIRGNTAAAMAQRFDAIVDHVGGPAAVDLADPGDPELFFSTHSVSGCRTVRSPQLLTLQSFFATTATAADTEMQCVLTSQSRDGLRGPDVLTSCVAPQLLHECYCNTAQVDELAGTHGPRHGILW